MATEKEIPRSRDVRQQSSIRFPAREAACTGEHPILPASPGSGVEKSGFSAAASNESQVFLALVHRGRNAWWRYVLSLALVALFTFVLSDAPLYVLREHLTYSDTAAFVATNLSFAIALAGLLLAVSCVHRRRMLTMVTPRASFDWRRAGQGFSVWILLAVVVCLIESLWYPERYRISFNPETFLIFVALALILTPLQTTAEELFFRGYLLQGMGLWTRRPVVLALANAIIFMLPHLANPEVAQDALLVPLQYLVIGLLLAAVTLRDGRLELAIGIHAANNLFIALLVNYENSVITTDAVFTVESHPEFSLVALVACSIIAYLWLCRRR